MSRTTKILIVAAIAAAGAVGAIIATKGGGSKSSSSTSTPSVTITPWNSDGGCSLGRQATTKRRMRRTLRECLVRRTIAWLGGHGMTTVSICGELMLAGTVGGAQVSVPLLGYLPDQGTIRTMSGIPSSASDPRSSFGRGADVP